MMELFCVYTVVVVSQVNVLIKLYILNGYILFYINYQSLFLKSSGYLLNPDSLWK